jgi:hypothetical protein
MTQNQETNIIKQYIIQRVYKILESSNVNINDWTISKTSSHIDVKVYDKSVKFSFFYHDIATSRNHDVFFKDFEYFVKFFRNDKCYKNSKTCLIDKLELIGK